MEGAPAAQAASQQADPSRQQQRPRNRRGRGGRGRGSEASSLSFRPASIPPEAAEAQVANAEAVASNRNQRGRGRGRGGVRGRGGRPAENRTVNGRAFGGQLTRDGEGPTDASVQPQLQASAPVFVPGQQHVHNVTQTQPTQRQPRQARQPKRRMSKSQAPDIVTRTHEDIDNGHYECAICTAEVKRNSKVWSCHTCWTVFHMGCIKKWSSNQGSTVNQQTPENGELPPPRQWRCPGCNLPQDVLPGSYTCWCEKEVDPKSPAGIPPHSCGQTCGKERPRSCPHPCSISCHAGPCPPCSHMGPTKPCFCGKHQTTKRCLETDYASSWSCGEVCNSPKPCLHRCERPCHDGPCGPCEVRLAAKCYCGEVEKDIMCSDQLEPKDCTRKYQGEDGETLVESFVGVFDCGNIYSKAYDCGTHKYQVPCQPAVEADIHCPYSPDLVESCACGKTPLTELPGPVRHSCNDPIPSCLRPCEKPLPGCLHPDPEICHSGECPPCRKVVSINCRCGRTTSNTICHQGDVEPPQCRRVCRVNLNCGRHACDERCCAGESKAILRQQSRKKQRPLNAGPRATDDGFEAEHICTRQCGRPLKCGSHDCPELCHKGPCPSCPEAIFEEISCFCGRTVLQPPLPCGTQPPVCRENCKRLKPCSHPQVPHNCHIDGDCPKCPFLVEKRCMCGKKALKNQQCWLRDVSCGEICGKRLSCGIHFCRSGCHRGPHEDADGCQQSCGKEKKCGHPHEAPCHAPFPCKESDNPCQSRIFITCACEAQKQEVRCGVSKSSEGNVDKTLTCNEECARLERNRKLAIALNIDQSSHVEGGDHVPYSNDTLNIFAQHVKWAQTQEREFRVFVDFEDERRLRFKPMQAQQRAFIHSLAEDFGLDSESIDPEPHRHVMIWKTPRFVSAPNKTIADALRIRQAAQRSANASANVSDNEGAIKVTKPKSLEPYNSLRITNVRFGLTIDEIRSEVQTVVPPNTTPFTFDIEFLPSEDVVLKAISRTLPPQDLERLLQNLKAPLATAIAAKGYGSTQLCTTDSSLNITRYEADTAVGDGWSKVAAKRAATKTNVGGTGLGNGTNNAFAALTGGTGGKVTFAKKKVEPKKKVKAEPVVDDWEAAELEAEEHERSANASEDDGVALTDGAPTKTVSGEEASLPLQQEGSDHQDWAAEVEAAHSQ